MQNNIYENILEINEIFNTKYYNQGFLLGTSHKAESFFTTGACWYYAYLLKCLYPEGEILIGPYHSVFKINNKFYDALGRNFEFDETQGFIDKEMRCSPAFIHDYHEEIILLVDFIIADLRNTKDTSKNMSL
ncbi:MAG: hypothetical protein PHG03_02960 [Bacilli bacterium]|nr:hypothetical protein [Bacilli bacterium]MDD4795501.1 hypothetical protein [Bacilli bacterium]